jgi:hypothetical protein
MGCLGTLLCALVLGLLLGEPGAGPGRGAVMLLAGIGAGIAAFCAKRKPARRLEEICMTEAADTYHDFTTRFARFVDPVGGSARLQDPEHLKAIVRSLEAAVEGD